MGSDTTEFVNKVMNQVRIRQKEMSTNAEDCTEHSILWGMFMATTLNAVTFMGKNYSTMQNVVQNEDNITLKQMVSLHRRSTMMTKFIVWTKSCIRAILGQNCR